MTEPNEQNESESWTTEGNAEYQNRETVSHTENPVDQMRLSKLLPKRDEKEQAAQPRELPKTPLDDGGDKKSEDTDSSSDESKSSSDSEEEGLRKSGLSQDVNASLPEIPGYSADVATSPLIERKGVKSQKKSAIGKMLGIGKKKTSTKGVVASHAETRSYDGADIPLERVKPKKKPKPVPRVPTHTAYDEHSDDERVYARTVQTTEKEKDYIYVDKSFGSTYNPKFLGRKTNACRMFWHLYIAVLIGTLVTSLLFLQNFTGSSEIIKDFITNQCIDLQDVVTEVANVHVTLAETSNTFVNDALQQGLSSSLNLALESVYVAVDVAIFVISGKLRVLLCAYDSVANLFGPLTDALSTALNEVEGAANTIKNTFGFKRALEQLTDAEKEAILRNATSALDNISTDVNMLTNVTTNATSLSNGGFNSSEATTFAPTVEGSGLVLPSSDSIEEALSSFVKGLLSDLLTTEVEEIIADVQNTTFVTLPVPEYAPIVFCDRINWEPYDNAVNIVKYLSYGIVGFILIAILVTWYFLYQSRMIIIWFSKRESILKINRKPNRTPEEEPTYWCCEFMIWKPAIVITLIAILTIIAFHLYLVGVNLAAAELNTWVETDVRNFGNEILAETNALINDTNNIFAKNFTTALEETKTDMRNALQTPGVALNNLADKIENTRSDLTDEVSKFITSVVADILSALISCLIYLDDVITVMRGIGPLIAKIPDTVLPDTFSLPAIPTVSETVVDNFVNRTQHYVDKLVDLQKDFINTSLIYSYVMLAYGLLIVVCAVTGWIILKCRGRDDRKTREMV